MDNKFNEQRKKYLLKVYQLTEGNQMRSVHAKALAKEIGISKEDESKIYYYLKEKDLVKPLYQGTVTLTSRGIDEAERIMQKDYEQQQYSLLKTLVENGEHNLIITDELAQRVNMSEPDAYSMLRTFEDKNWVELFENATAIKHGGIEAFHKWNKSPTTRETTSYVIHGNVGALQHKSANSTQFVHQAITQTNNPDFNEAIAGILEVIKSAEIDGEEKETLINDVRAVNNLANKEPTASLIERAKSRVNLLDASLKAADLTLKAAPYLPQIKAFFDELMK